MRFADPLYFLLAIPALTLFFLYIRGWIGKDAALKFSSLKLVRDAGGKKLTFRRVFPALMRLACLLLIAAALARPQTGTGEEKARQDVVDIAIALDVSGSMATLDFQPENRLNAAKVEARKFIGSRKDDRLALIIFAGQSFTQCPLTVDHKAILALLDKIELGMLEDGTAIGLGLANAINRLKDSEAKSKVVILLTDGVNNAGEIDPLMAADLARKYKIRVYTVGVGKEGTALLPVQDPRFGTRFLKVDTQIDEKTLHAISERTGGMYFRARDEQGLHNIFRQIDRLERTEVTVEKFTHYEERYFWYLWPAIFLLLAEVLWAHAVFVKIP